MTRLRAAGAEAGRHAAQWWAQDTVGGRAGGDTRAAARRILAGIDDGDPAVLDTLPRLDLSGQWADAPTEADLYTDAVGDAGPAWATLDDDQRDAAIAAYRDAFDTAALDHVAELCRLAASPTGRDVSHLHPDRVRIGSIGVFAGDWAYNPGADGDRIDVGFVGTLIDRWNGWAVFSCTRQVAEAIVADQQHLRQQVRESLQAQGVAAPDLDRRVNAEMTDLRFDGDVLVADQRAMSGDPEAIEHITADADGRWVVMGWNWCWEAVDPYTCDRIVGDLPDPGDAQQFALLAHTPGMRVPHTRLHLDDVRPRPAPVGVSPAFTATLMLDDEPVATVNGDGTGAIACDPPQAATTHDGLRNYVACCRYRGRPVSWPRLLRAVTDEHLVSHAVADAESAGGTVLRLVDDTDRTHALQPIPAAPRRLPDLLRLGRTLTPVPGRQWQIWTGTGWFTVPGPAPR